MKQLTLALLVSTVAIAAAAQEPSPQIDPESRAMMEQAATLAEPGIAHKNLARAAGKWRTRTRIWAQGPDSKPTTTTGICNFEMILGGRFLKQECDGEFMPGVPFQGVGLEGYDNFRKQQVSVWLDSTSTTISTMIGSCDAAGENCIYHGSMDDIATGEIGKTIKSELHWTGRDKMVFDVYDSAPGGEWVRLMSITYVKPKTE